MRFDITVAAVAVAGLVGLASAFPSKFMYFMTRHLAKREEKLASQIILEIAPNSGVCANVSFPDECATNVHAAPYLINSMFAYKLYEPAQIGAVIALIAFESSEFKYNRNHFPEPGNPGQGSRNMQSINYNLLYAQSKKELASQLPEGDADSFTDDQKNQVLALVMEDPYTWDTGPWFLATQCEPSVRDKLASDPDAGWTDYMACIGVENNEDREAYWTAAKTAWGIA